MAYMGDTCADADVGVSVSGIKRQPLEPESRHMDDQIRAVRAVQRREGHSSNTHRKQDQRWWR